MFTTLMRLRPPNLLYHSYKSPSDLLRSSGLTQKWVNREITNFDYLMQVALPDPFLQRCGGWKEGKKKQQKGEIIIFLAFLHS